MKTTARLSILFFFSLLIACEVIEVETPEKQPSVEYKSLSLSYLPPAVLYDLDKKEGHSRSVPVGTSWPSLSKIYWSETTSIDNDIGSIYVPAHGEATVCKNASFGGDCKTFIYNSRTTNYWSLAKYGYNNNISSMKYQRAVTDARADLWDDYDYLGNWPNDRENSYSESIQGVANDGNYWYISNQYNVRRIHITENLNSSHSDEVHNLRDGGCDHIGDLDYFNGELFEPMENCDGAKYQGQDRIYVFNTKSIVRVDQSGRETKDLKNNSQFKFVRYGYFTKQDHASWVAVNPHDGLMYSSNYKDVDKVYGYNRTFTNGTALNPIRTLYLNETISCVQGGTFDPDGYLYLTTSAYSCSGSGGSNGIHVFRVVGNNATKVRSIGPNGIGTRQELEGITWWDLDAETRTAPNIDGGQLHWLLLDNESVDVDDFWFKHIRLE